jgi:hypothetical protein
MRDIIESGSWRQTFTGRARDNAPARPAPDDDRKDIPEMYRLLLAALNGLRGG